MYIIMESRTSPCNGFILFKNLNKEDLLDSFEKVHKRMPVYAELVVFAANVWSTLPGEIKRDYYQLAREEWEVLRRHYPIRS